MKKISKWLRKNKTWTLVGAMALLTIVGILVFTIARQPKNQTQSSDVSSPASTTSDSTEPDQTTQDTATTPTDSGATPPASSSTPSPKPTSSTPTPPHAPKPPVLTPSVTISSDGCSVTFNGTQGFLAYVSITSSGHGGDSDYTLPFSGTLTTTTGNTTGDTVTATLKDSSGNQLIQKTSTITAPYCY